MTTGLNDNVAKKSLHSRIIGDIEKEILSGQWPPGHKIPSEQELTELYSCSRMTANKAIVELVNRGLVIRRRKTGSHVAQPRIQTAILEIPDIPNDVKARGLPYRFEKLHHIKRTATPAELELLESASPLHVLELTVLHLAGNQPFCLENRLINLEAIPEATDEAFAVLPPGSWLISQVPWKTAQHRIRATSADKSTSEILQITQGAACLRIERLTKNMGVCLTHAYLTYSGENHELFAEFEPSYIRS